MTRGALTLFAFISAIYFPWVFTVLFALALSLAEPLIPLAIGIFLDTLYYAPSVETLPFFTLGGAVATAVMLFVHSRLRTGIING